MRFTYMTVQWGDSGYLNQAVLVLAGSVTMKPAELRALHKIDILLNA